MTPDLYPAWLLILTDHSENNPPDSLHVYIGDWQQCRVVWREDMVNSSCHLGASKVLAASSVLRPDLEEVYSEKTATPCHNIGS